MALINGNDYDHIDFTKNGVTTRHMLKDTLSRQMSGDLVKVQNEEPTSEGTKIWIKPSGDSEVQVPTYEEFEELSDKIDDADATITSLAVGAQPTVSVTEVDGHKRFSFGIPASNGIASITKTATDGVIDTYTIAMTDGTSTSFSVNNSDITPESMAEAIATALQDYARIDGYYPDLTAGNADQLNSTKFVENKEPYLYRPSGGTSDIGNRKYLDAIVGVSLPWNQMVRDEASENQTDFADILTVTDAVEDSAALKVKIEPQQDLHGYDHPWPAGGGVNKLNLAEMRVTSSTYGFTATIDGEEFVFSGTYNASITNPQFRFALYTDQREIPYKCKGFAVDATTANHYNGFVGRADSNMTLTIQFTNCVQGETYNFRVRIVAYEGDTAPTAWTPYSNICPITGWTAAKVTRTRKNLLKTSGLSYVPPSSTVFGVNTKRTFVENSYCNGITYNNACQVGRATDIAVSENSIQFTTNARVYGVNIPVIGLKVGRAYTVSAIITNGIIGVGFYEQDGTYISGTPNANSFTVPDRTYYVLLAFQAATENEQSVFTKIQLELGSTATAYEPYSSNTYDITLPSESGTVYGGELTVNADRSGSLVVDRAKVDMGTLAWSTTTTDTAGKNRFMADIVDIKIGSMNDVQLLCSAYKEIAATVVYGTTGITPHGTIARVLVADVAKAEMTGTEFKSAMSGVQLIYPLATHITYTLTASEVTTLLGTNNIWADTGDVALTYTGTDEHLTLESGRKYLARINGTDSMLLGSAQEITAVKGTDNVFDLTKMFGTSVADYVYNQGAGYFRKWFGKTWYPYNTGELKHVEGLQSHDLVGFNQIPAIIPGELIRMTTGEALQNPDYAHTDYVPVIPGYTYYFHEGTTATGEWSAYYDANKNFVRGISLIGGRTFTPTQEVSYVRATIRIENIDKTCISLAHDGSRNGEYEPYEKHSHSLDNTVILRGVPKVDANGVYWDGDRYLPDGTVERRYDVVDLGTLDWEYDSTRIAMVVTGNKTPINTAVTNPQGVPTVACSEYLGIPNIGTQADATDKPDKTIFFYHNADIRSKRLFVKDSSYTDVVAFKAAMSGVYLVYELAEPTIEQALPYRNFQLVDDWGTEEFVTTGMIPVGHESRYPANLRDKLQHLPDAAGSNGSYLITQTDGQMTLTPFPAPPTTAGKYALRATVTNGVATFTWEATT